MDPWAECYLRHYQKFLGKPFDIREFRGPEDLRLKLATYDLAVPGHRVYGSIGLASMADRLDCVGEVVLVAPTGHREVPGLFLNALFCIAAQKIGLMTRFAIDGIDAVNPNFAEKHHKSALYFTLVNGFSELFETVEGWEETGLVFQASFITPEENALLKREGGPALEDKLTVIGNEVWRLDRPSTVS